MADHIAAALMAAAGIAGITWWLIHEYRVADRDLDAALANAFGTDDLDTVEPLPDLPVCVIERIVQGPGYMIGQAIAHDRHLCTCWDADAELEAMVSES